MEPFILKGTMKIPDVRFDPEKGQLDISGRSIPENAKEFYTPLYEWLKEYEKNPKEQTTFNLKILYFNSRSLKALTDFMYTLDDIHAKGFDVTINWFYETDDDDILEVGEDYKSMVKCPFKLIGYSSVDLGI